ncbi:MAG: uracil-DNA glycosylase [Rhodoferax sp.]|nr:uracil-DNA glycosylase [Rhodoferax sp.]
MQISLLPDGQEEAIKGSLTTQLQSADPGRWLVDPSWWRVTQAFFASPQGRGLRARLEKRLEDGAVVFPPEPFRALATTPLGDVQVVILGQDPYHGRGQADGLAFSVSPGIAVPPSLRNIFKELAREGASAQRRFPLTTGSLLPWAQRGVLLLNTCLSVEQAQPSSHFGWGWETLTDAVIQEISDRCDRVVFLLWGQHAQAKQKLINPKRHLVLCANHPSPLAASRPPIPFLGCGHFGLAANWLGPSGDAR